MDVLDILLDTTDVVMMKLCTPCDDFIIRRGKDEEWSEEWCKRAFYIAQAVGGSLVPFSNYLPKNYEDFLRTPYWKIISYWVKKKADYKCIVCDNSEETLNAHHKTYTRYQHEYEYWEDDLICLCQTCHMIFHRERPRQDMMEEKVAV